MRIVAILSLALALPSGLLAQTPDHRTVERDILKQLVEINTSDSARHTDLAAQAMKQRLLAAGIPDSDIQVLELDPGIFSLVARYRGRGTAKPILMIAHLDVVGARREDWTVDPFTFLERDGYYYGRGSSDDKAGVAMLVANLIRLKQEGFVPDRDLIIALTGDEETTSTSIQKLVKEHRDLVDAEYALNADAGGGEYRDNKPVTFVVQTAEKVYLTFNLEVRNKGGHSSLPEPDNAIYRLAAGLGRLSRFSFPVRLNATSRTFLQRAAVNQPPSVARDMRAVARTGSATAAARLSREPYFNSIMRTTCVATRLFGGHADNALPQLARATVNCRMVPDDSQDSVEAVLRRVVADTAIHFSVADPATPSPASPLRADLMQPIEAIAKDMWPSAVVVPEMSTGATDGAYVRNAGIPTYGTFAVFEDPNDIRIHGRDERIGVKEFHDAVTFWYRLIKAVSGA
ncbi:MAG TPA: M20/M25/M40 family metallo-hydrolase [Gemmatimonadales bacterium]|nr:M20/M25/M40 family metallo-hydrolase [Gemmatimonadales bacterium]